uniref:Uncharacterized protein n=1 Tax=Anguilla anguilla TaxID=7936 RepID=A0A0E9PED0_ANGAN
MELLSEKLPSTHQKHHAASISSATHHP